MDGKQERRPAVSVAAMADGADMAALARLREQFDIVEPGESADGEPGVPVFRLDADGLALLAGGQVLRGDFKRMLPRLKGGNLPKELLVRAAKIKGENMALTAVDATAGLGEDSLLLAAAGFHVKLYERNPVIHALLEDTVRRARAVPELHEAAARMQVFYEDSIEAMKYLEAPPDVILLDPMFPARQKSALVKKKLQMIQKLELPCLDEAELFLSAVRAAPKKLIIKRPPKGPYLAGIKPDHSIEGKAVRFDCIVSPYDRIGKFETALR